MSKITKADFVAEAAANYFRTKSEAEHAVNAILETLVNEMARGSSVTFMGFGTFETVIRKGGEGRNPKTGEVIKIPQKRIPKFKPGATLKAAVNGA